MSTDLRPYLPQSALKFVEFTQGLWRTLWERADQESESSSEIQLRVFGLVRGRLTCQGPVEKGWVRCLELLLERRLIERCQELWSGSKAERTEGLKEILATDSLQRCEGESWEIRLSGQAKEFFEVGSLNWCSSVEGQPDLKSIEACLESEAARLLVQLKSEDYSSLLGVFGHHVGTLFKTSGAMTVWSLPDPGDDPTRRVLDKLLPIWGVSQAISLHKKQGEKGWKELLRDWVDPGWTQRNDLPEAVQQSLLSLALYVYAHGVDEPPFLPWVVHLPDGRQARWLWATADAVESGVPEELIEEALPEQTPDKVEVESQTHRLVSLPPLADNPILFDKTLALSIGLFEVLSNLRKYPEARGAGREDRADLAQLQDEERQVDLTILEKEKSTTLRIVQPVVVLPNGEIPISRSVERIRGLERSLLNGIIETSRAEVHGKTSIDYVVKMRQEWTYHWGELLEEWECHVNSD